MGGNIRLGGRAVVPGHNSPPYSFYEYTDGGLCNVWRVINGVPTRTVEYTVYDVENGEEMACAELSPDESLTSWSWNFPRPGAGFDSGAVAVSATGGAPPPTYISAYDSGGPWMLHPSWGPNSDRLVYIHGDPVEGFNGSIVEVLLSAPGSETVLYTPVPVGSPSGWGAYQPRYSPDGTQISFLLCSNGGSTAFDGLYVMDADGSNVTQIDGWGSFGYGFEGQQYGWSPDGSLIAYWASEDFSGKLYVIAPDGTGKTRIDVGEVATNPFLGNVRKRLSQLCWSPAGDYVVGSAEWWNGTTTVTVPWRFELDGVTPETRLNDSNGPPNASTFYICVYVFGNRIWYIPNGFDTVCSMALDGTDVTIDHDVTLDGYGFTNGIGWLYP